MSSQKFEITNPEAIKLINDLKSGKAYKPVTDFLKKYRWYLISVLVLIAIFITISIAKMISAARTPKYTPPDLSVISVTPTPTVKSKFDSLKKSLVDFSTVMPDPAIPPVDNKISLEVNLQD